ncbi:PMEI domain-containing protein [Citrus sinensis]|uniref:PMEI domain-containing protein n=1 Tax=Citrus sinensis TaxID=2711 RepID=A0ACB8IAA0_CITSI|nr:PMEI domain-containing protein [Citrus sinensis]
MKAPNFLLLLLLLSVIVPVIIQCDDNLINQICRRTPFRDLCIATLEPNTNSSSSDVKGLASIMANIVLGNASDTLNYIEGLIKQAPDPQQERALANCAELYIPVVRYELPQAIDALSKGHFGFANYCIADAGKQADACEKGFSGSAKSPLSDRNNLVKSLCGIAIAIINLLAKRLS